MAKIPRILLSLAALLLAGLLGYGIGRFTEWYSSPLAPPLCVGIGADLIQGAVDEFYRAFWLKWLAAGGAGALVIGASIAVPLCIIAYWVAKYVRSKVNG